jgi:hypothetical protein
VRVTCNQRGNWWTNLQVDGCKTRLQYSSRISIKVWSKFLWFCSRIANFDNQLPAELRNHCSIVLKICRNCSVLYLERLFHRLRSSAWIIKTLAPNVVSLWNNDPQRCSKIKKLSWLLESTIRFIPSKRCWLFLQLPNKKMNCDVNPRKLL